MTALFGWEWVEVLHITCDRFFSYLAYLARVSASGKVHLGFASSAPPARSSRVKRKRKGRASKEFRCVQWVIGFCPNATSNCGFHWFRLVFCPLDCQSSTSGHAQTTRGYIFKSWAIKSVKNFSNCVWDTLPVQSFQKEKSGALAPSLQEFSWNWGCHNAESHLGRGRASKMRAVFDSWVPHSQKHGTLSGYLFVFLSLRHISWRIDVPKKCDLQVNSPCSSVAISKTYV